MINYALLLFKLDDFSLPAEFHTFIRNCFAHPSSLPNSEFQPPVLDNANKKNSRDISLGDTPMVIITNVSK